MDSQSVDLNPNYTTTTTSLRNSPIDSLKEYQQQQQFVESLQQEDHLYRNPSNSTANSYSHRDSRVQSIYDRYLYRQESKRLARNASKISTKSPGKVHKRLASIKEMSQPASFKKKRQSALIASRKDNRESKPDGSAWAGMMMGNVSSDESDSDDSDGEVTARVTAPSASSNKSTPAGQSRSSWSSRAFAVGSRPPDSASQNPPSLKLLGLKSVKEGGAPIGFNSKISSNLEVKQQARNVSPAFDMVADEAKFGQGNRILSTSDYGDDVGRHGSYIEFGGSDIKAQASPTRGYQLHDGPIKQASSSLQPPNDASSRGPASPRTALTQELGLITPQPTSQQAQGQSTSYFQPMDSPVNGSPHRNLMPAGQNRQQVARSTQMQMPSPVKNSSSAQSIPLQRGPPSPGFPVSPNQNRQVLSNLGQMRSAPAPMPIPLPSPVYPPSAGAPLMGGGPPSYHSERPSIDARSGPNSAPGFSDSPQLGGRQMAQRHPSLLRRSMAFITGADLMPTHQRQPSAGTPKKGLWRRSMAILTNRPLPATAVPGDDYCESPRVAGFVDEKPRNRNSEYIGASGMGDEWDYSGYGAKFWKRFSIAQRRELEGKNKDSEAFRSKMAKRRKLIMAMSLLGGLIIIGGVIAIIIWRENVTSSATPGSIDRQNEGVNAATTPNAGYDVNNGTTVKPDTTYTPQTEYSPATDQNAVTSTSTRRHHHNTDNRKRATATPISNVVDRIKREVLASTPSYYGGVHPLPRDVLIRKRKHSERAFDSQVTRAPQA